MVKPRCAECGAPATHWTEASGESRYLCLIHAAKHPPANMYPVRADQEKPSEPPSSGASQGGEVPNG